MADPPVPLDYQSLVGKTFRDTSGNGMNRLITVEKIEFRPHHQWGPWLARVRLHHKASWRTHEFTLRKIQRFLDMDGYKEVKLCGMS